MSEEQKAGRHEGPLEALVGRLRERADKMATKGNAAALREAADALENIWNALGCETECPCCQRNDVCEDECTFIEDAPEDAERMDYMRRALTPNAG